MNRKVFVNGIIYETGEVYKSFVNTLVYADDGVGAAALTIEHKDIGFGEIHEPKGLAAVGSGGQAYLSDGVGGGSWTGVQIAEFACLQVSAGGDTTGVTTGLQVINDATLGGTIAFTQNASLGITTNTTDGYMTVAAAGTYQISFTAQIEPATSGSTYIFTIGVDSGAGIVDREAFVKSEVRTTGTNLTFPVSFVCLPSFAANDKVYLMVKETTAGEEFELVSANFTITRIS